MKKFIILGVSCLMAFPLTGCTTAKVEKEPVVIGASDESDQLDDEKVTNASDQKTIKNDTLNSSDDQEDINQQVEGNNTSSNNPSKEDNDSASEDTISDVAAQDDATKNGTVASGTTTVSEDTYKGTVLLEGMEEEVTYKTFKSDLGYQIAYDIDRFTVSSENGKDTFMVENPNPELYPYVYITIGRTEYTGEEVDFYDSDLHLRDEETGKDLVANSEKDTVKIGEYDAIHWQLIDGNEWNSLVKHYYFIPGENYYYWIQTNYFLEASEGFGARISAMLDTFILE